MKRRLTLLLIALFLVAANVLPALAATQKLTLTEAQMNATFLALLPPELAALVNNPTVDLQSGRVVINATLKSAPSSLRVVVRPVISGGTVSWRVASATVGGMALPSSVRAILTNYVLNAWNACIAAYGASNVTAVQITATNITFTYTTP